MDDDLNLEDVSGIALAAYLLTVNAVRLLKERNIFTQADVNALFGGVLSSLEADDRAADPSAHAARVLLSGAASDQGVPLKKPS